MVYPISLVFHLTPLVTKVIIKIIQHWRRASKIHELSDNKADLPKIGNSLTEVFKISQEITQSDLEFFKESDLRDSKKCFWCREKNSQSCREDAYVRFVIKKNWYVMFITNFVSKRCRQNYWIEQSAVGSSRWHCLMKISQMSNHLFTSRL